MTNQSEQALRKEMVVIGKRLYSKNLITACDGNISCRLGENRFLITPSGVSKGFLKEEDLIVIDKEGHLIEGTGKPSSEVKMHLAVYKLRNDIKAVLHAHPPLLTAITLSKIPFDTAFLPELWLTAGNVPIAPYGTPSTEELPETIRPYVTNHKAILLERHGSLTMADTIEKAYFILEKLEQGALIILYTYLLSGRLPNPLSEEERRRLYETFHNSPHS